MAPARALSVAVCGAPCRRFDVVQGDEWSGLLGKFAKHVFKSDTSSDLSSHMTSCLGVVKFSIVAGVDVHTVLVQYGVRCGVCMLIRLLFEWTRLEGRTPAQVADAAANVRVARAARSLRPPRTIPTHHPFPTHPTPRPAPPRPHSTHPSSRAPPESGLFTLSVS